MAKPGSTPSPYRIAPEELTRIAEANRAAAIVESIKHDAALLRLASMAQAELDLAPAVSHSIEASTRQIAERIQRRTRRLAALVAAGAVAAGALVGVAPAADAAVVPVSSSARIVISGPTARVQVTAWSTAPETGDGGHALAVSVAGTTLWGASTVPDMAPELVTVTGTVRSAALTPGTSKVLVTDIGDGKWTTVPVTVVRQSAVKASTVVYPGGVLVMGTAKHYDPRTGGYTGDVASPVQVQEWTSGKWVTVQTVTTAGPDGAVAAMIPVPFGPALLRLVRPAGTTVTGAVSALQAVVVPGGWA